MVQRKLGVHVSGDSVTVVDAEVPDDGPITIVMDQSFRLQKGDRGKAFCTMYSRLHDYAREKNINVAIIKESAANQRGMGLAHLQAAELRGVAIAALASVSDLIQVSKASVSKNFGDRKVDDYLKDDGFWNTNLNGELRSGSREAAMLILATRS